MLNIDHRIINSLKDSIHSDFSFIDIGAHNGNFSFNVLYAYSSFIKKIVMIEPEIERLEEAKIDATKYPNTEFEFVPKLITMRQGDMYMYYSKRNNYYIDYNSFGFTENTTDHLQVKCDSMKFDDYYVDKTEEFDMITVDVQFGIYDIIHSLENYLTNHKLPIMAIRLDNLTGKNFVRDMDSINYLYSIGYKKGTFIGIPYIYNFLFPDK